MTPGYARLALLATLLAFVVVMLGAYTRLSDAGLGCPDWPGCYGHLTVPKTSADMKRAEQAFPGQVVEAPKAWKEMIHRYVAGSLGVLIIVLALWAIARKRVLARQPLLLPLFLVLLVVFQAALGMWTVTWKVLPIIVSAHLLGGMALVALLWYLYLSTRPQSVINTLTPSGFRPWVILGLLILIVQLFLGAWTSTTYSALACHDFPFCHGSLFPAMNLREGFQLVQPIGVNYEGGVLETPARIAIQMMHRYGALVTGLYWATLSLCVLCAGKARHLRLTGGVLLTVLIVQILLGIANVVWLLPLWTAVLHNGVAALLLVTVVTLLYQLRKPAQLKF